MDAILLQVLNGLDKGSAYALIALGLTLIFGTLGVVNFAHGALFMIGAFCAVTLQKILTLAKITIDPDKKDFLGNPLKVETPYVTNWFGADVGNGIIEWSVPLAILFAIPVMIAVGFAMERGLIRHFYKRPHADQILVTFGLAIVLQEIVKYYFGANPIQTPAPDALSGSMDIGLMFGFTENALIYPVWRMVYFLFALIVIGAVFAFLQFTTFGMVIRAGMADRETVGLLGIDIDRRFTMMFGIAAAVAVLPGSCTRQSTRPTTTWEWISSCSASLSSWSAAWDRCQAPSWPASCWVCWKALLRPPGPPRPSRGSIRSSSTLSPSSFCSHVHAG